MTAPDKTLYRCISFSPTKGSGSPDSHRCELELKHTGAHLAHWCGMSIIWNDGPICGCICCPACRTPAHNCPCCSDERKKEVRP